jgi:hypothetical protein
MVKIAAFSLRYNHLRAFRLSAGLLTPMLS